MGTISVPYHGLTIPYLSHVWATYGPLFTVWNPYFYFGKGGYIFRYGKHSHHINIIAINIFQLGNHHLHIETGRHSIPKTLLWNLKNRFHVAVRLFSNRSQMTSKCGKNKKVAHEAIAECVTNVLTTIWHLLWSINKLLQRKLFYFKIFQHNPALAHFGKHEKSHLT